MESITQVLRRKAETRLENALANGLRPRRALKDYSNQKSLYVYESTDDENSDHQEEPSTKERSKRKPMPRSKRRSTRNGGRESSAQSDDSEDVPLAKKFTNSKNQNNDSSEEDVPLAKKFSGPKRKKGRPRKIKSESEEDEDDKSNISDDKDKVQESVENGHDKQNGQEAVDEEEVKNEVKDEPIEEKNPRLGREFEGQSIPQEQPLLIKGGVMKGYQIEGLMWMASLRKVKANGILADEMGLGKTLQTISLFCHVAEVEKDAGPFLVIAPLSTLHNWKREVERFAPGFPVKVKFKIFSVEINL